MSAEPEITGTAQREAWRQRVVPPVEQLEADLWSLPVPIPANPLRYVSVYAFGAGQGLVLIDAGWGAEESWLALRAGLESIGAGWPAVSRTRAACAAGACGPPVREARRHRPRAGARDRA